MGKSLKLIVESLLFASDEPLSARDIHSYLSDVNISDIKSALKVLKYEYEAFGRSFGLREVAKGYQFRSRSEYGSHILKMLQRSPNRLSRAAMETLAIIAYKQPIIRHEIERLRGVDVGGILRNLLEKNLIRIMGRKDLPGRPLIYGTTKKFLEIFDLQDIESLPKLKEIKAFGTEEYEPTKIGEETKTQEPPGDEAFGEEGPGEEDPGEEDLGKEGPGDEAFGEEGLGKEGPGEEDPGDEGTGEEDSGDEPPGDEGSEEGAVRETENQQDSLVGRSDIEAKSG